MQLIVDTIRFIYFATIHLREDSQICDDSFTRGKPPIYVTGHCWHILSYIRPYLLHGLALPRLIVLFVLMHLSQRNEFINIDFESTAAVWGAASQSMISSRIIISKDDDMLLPFFCFSLEIDDCYNGAFCVQDPAYIQ